jgi:hypothetical protein
MAAPLPDFFEYRGVFSSLVDCPDDLVNASAVPKHNCPILQRFRNQGKSETALNKADA